MGTSGKVIRKERCPTPGCDGAGDNVAVYEDNSKFCHACNTIPRTASKPITPPKELWEIKGTIHEIQSRGLSHETCRWANYQIAKTSKGTTHVANYYDRSGNRLIGQKLRFPPDPYTGKKQFEIRGDGENLPLYLSWKWSPNDKLFITVVEGEIDALTVAQAQGYQYPVVSIPKGAGDAEKALKSNLKYLLGFKYVVLGLDSDDAGTRETQKCVKLFEPGRIRTAVWPLKDANELHLAGRDKEIKEAIFCAKEVVPESIITISDRIEQALQRPVYGSEYPWRSLTQITYGHRYGEIHIIVASTGIGKTEYIKDIMFHMLDNNCNVALFSFEQNPADTIRRLVGAKLGVKLHLPGAEWDENKIRAEAEKFQDKLYLYDKAGRVDIADLFNSIRYLARAKGVRLFVVDNLKAIGIANDNDRADYFMNTLKALVKELDITVYLLSHTAKDKFSYSTYVTTSPKNPDTYNKATAEQNGAMINKPGLEWESGRMPTVANVEGSGVVTQLADYVFALARNKHAEDQEERRTIRVKVLKSRLDSAQDGKIFRLVYNDRGTLEELGSPSDRPY